MKKITPDLREQIIRRTTEGQPRSRIAEELGVTPSQVSAVLAHQTMGTYAPIATDATVHASDSKVGRRILLGADAETNTDVWWQLDPDAGTPNPHLLIVGESGTGKTYAVACILAEIVRQGLSSIVFDYGQGFATGAIDSDFVPSSEPTYVDVAARGININPLQIFSSDIHGPVTVAQRVADTFARVYPKIGVQQHSVLRNVVLRVLQDAGIEQGDKRTWTRQIPAFSALRDALEQGTKEGEPRRRALTSSVASHISTIFFYDTFRASGISLQWSDIIAARRIYILNLKGLEQSLEQVITEFLLWNLIGYTESAGPGPLRCFVVIDEAHKITFGQGSPIDRLLREGRKFGLAALLASQQAEDFSAVAFSNTATKLIFQVSDEMNRISRRLYRKAATHSLQRISDVITKLKRGFAYAVTQNTGAVVRIASFQDRKDRWKRDQGGTT